MKKSVSALCFILSVLFIIPLFSLASFAKGISLNYSNEEAQGRVGVLYDNYYYLPEEQTTEEGLVFRGWAISKEDADAGIVTYAAGLNYIGDNINDLYAVSQYTVTLRPGPEGYGSGSYTLYKTPGVPLTLLSEKYAVATNYNIWPGNLSSDQRVLIEWNTAFNSTTSRGTGTSYRDYYTADASVTLYAIYGYPIVYNADGGIFPDTGTSVYESYVANYNSVNYKDPKTLYGNFGFPDGEHGTQEPYKEGCSLARSSDGKAFLLIRSNGKSIFTTESAKQNLTIPPTGGAMPWSSFHLTTTSYGQVAPEFYAAWIPSIIYEPNGANGSTKSYSLDISYGTLYNYTDHTVKKVTALGYSKSGDEFTGWNTKPDGGGITYAPGDTIPAKHSSSDSIHLYAQWDTSGGDTPAYYYVTYKANGGSGGPSYQAKRPGETLRLSTTTPTREGFTFLGWATSANATSAEYSAGAYYSADADITLYAVWSRAYYVVSFDSNGSNDTPPSNVRKYPGVTVSIPTTELTKTGYSFLGWSESPSASKATYAPGDSYTTDADIKLYAVWKADKFTITFDANGGSGGPTSARKNYGTPLVIPSAVPEREGYVFLGWNTRSTATSAVYRPGDNFYLNASLTLYAVWREAETYTVTFNPDGGTFVGGESSYQIKEGSRYSTVMDALPVVEKAGYDFVGWYYGDTVITLDSVYNIEGNITVTAHWNEKPLTYTITFDPGDGAIVSGESSYEVIAGNSYSSVITSTPKPELDGYSFRGWWYYQADGTPLFCISDGTELNPAGTGNNPASLDAACIMDLNLQAWWVYDRVVLSFDTAGGDGSFDDISGSTGSVVTLPLSAPEKQGYMFIGWSESATSESAEYLPGSEFTLTEDTVLYAVYSLAYTITFDTAGGQIVSGQSEYKICYGMELSDIMDRLPSVNRYGYTFSGWYDGEGNRLLSTGIIFDLTEDITFTARWSATKHIVVFDAMGGNGGTDRRNKTYGEPLYLNNALPSKEGYTFLGWSVYPDVSEPEYRRYDYLIDDDIYTLYAVWGPEKTITFDAAGGSISTGRAVYTAYAGQRYSEIMSAIPTVRRGGFTFAGWYDQYGNRLLDRSVLFNGTENIVYTARWTAAKHLVIFDANGGSGGTSARNKEYEVGLYLNNALPSREGYTFLGWSTEPDATEPEYYRFDYLYNDEITVLYVVWGRSATITFDPAGGSISTGRSLYYAYDGQRYSDIMNAVPTVKKGNFVFAGWYDQYGNRLLDRSITFEGAEDIIYTARWEAAKHLVTFDANGGSGGTTARNKIDGEALYLNNALPTRSGYTFLGWSTDADATEPEYLRYDYLSDDTVTILYAVWG